MDFKPGVKVRVQLQEGTYQGKIQYYDEKSRELIIESCNCLFNNVNKKYFNKL